MFKFLHAADIHLDSPLTGLSRYDDAPTDTIRSASRRAFEKLIQTAIEERVAFVLISGDLYDGDWNDYSTGSFFLKRASQLREAGIPLYLIAGNHDAANKMTKSLDLRGIATMLDHRRAESHHLEDYNVTIHGQSFARQEVTEDLSQSYPPAVKGQFNIGMLHTCATGRDGHASYAPCSIEGLRNRGYDYWALGHVHNREVLLSEPQIVFPGNLQGRHARETGPKGAYLVEVQNDHHCQLEFRPLDVFRWEHLKVDVSAAETVESALQLTSEALADVSTRTDDLPAAVRVELVGHSPAHRQLHSRPDRYRESIRVDAYQHGRDELWVEKIQFHTRPSQNEKLIDRSGPWGELEELLQQCRGDVQKRDVLKKELSDVFDKLPQDVLQSSGCEKEEWWQEVLNEVESRLSSELFSEPHE